ncbi:MAG TPA: hypothetical protein VMK65_01115, partial [Longimicrobiales bacterium]|nr:hypothetical protein [Longimicrobiales bacterium]
PAELHESSGAAFSRRDPSVLWSHNDSGGDPVLVAMDSTGAVLGRVRVRGAENRDWEDIASAPCGPEGGDCLWIADTGDNHGARARVTLYRIPEPEPGAGVSASAEAFHAVYPGGPRDAETLAVTPEGQPYLVTKGRYSGIAVFRYPLPLRPGATAELEPVHAFTAGPVELPEQVTGGAWTHDGRYLVLRTYTRVGAWRAQADGTLADALPGGVSLEPLQEFQGEAMALRHDGVLAFTSEAGDGVPGPIGMMRCRFE